MENRIILHLDMDAFFAQIEERENPQFKGKPIVVGAEPKGGQGRGVVSTANYEARKYGIHSALPISQAFRLCPTAIFLPVNMSFYEKISTEIMEIIKKYSNIWEIVSLDEAYLDISFLKSFEKAKKLAVKLKKEIFEKEKLTSTVGIGPNKMIAKMASEKAKPDGLMIVPDHQIDEFLEPLDMRKKKEKIKRESEDLKKKFYKEYYELQEDIKRQIKMFREAKARRKLTREEEALERQLLNNLADIERVLIRELKDIEDIK